ncbi:MAG: hypothetical protein FWC26_08935 [Fibromonadales bacterium]|nr:hypothetical protein [Fibromonadales bacterium]
MRNSILAFLLLLATIANAAQTFAVLEITQAGEIGHAIGSVLLGTGIAIHIWF